MTHDLQQKLKSRWKTFTASEQKIAAYLLQNLNSLPFETAASLGKRVDVSAMTVGRFLRKLGYVGVGAMKDELRGDATWLKLYRNPSRSGNAASDAERLDAEMRTLSAVYALARGEEWQAIVRLLASAERVSVASFQLGSFLGMTFATLLQHVRPRVAFASGLDGAYTDVLVDSTERSCVVLIDDRRYSRHFRILAEQVAARGIPLIIITDAQCYWARQLTSHVLMIPVSGDRTWHNFGAFTALFSLLLDGVIRALDDAVYDRIEQITDLRQKFIGFSGPALAGSRTHPAPPRTDGTTNSARRVRKRPSNRGS
ncbi:MAG TPA: MurR/RpiR family transcriptional regulator [Rhodanobacteraceae bacterium]|nr:MurR/RpiR family transcriptional regulator [Rhodanobacteraceae bacterium]